MLALALDLALDLAIRSQPLGIDFHTYFAAASVGEQRGWSHIYDRGLVAEAQRQLVPHQHAQPYLSPPPEAWLVAALTALPYWLAYGVWAALMLGALAFALAWSTSYRGPARLVAVGVALAPWWVLWALYVGQVAPLVAASVLIAWRLVRQERDVAAGIVLSLVLLKPQTAAIVPLALLAAGRYRVLAAWVAAAATVFGTSLLTLGPHGVAEYMSALGHVPTTAYDLTLGGALGLTGTSAAVSRVVVVGAALAIAYRMRSTPGIAIAAGVLASLLATPYMYHSDLCLLGAAGWILWEERPTPFWRASLVTIWMLATPYSGAAGLGLTLRQWPLVELALFVVLVVVVWQGGHARASFTGEADLRTLAPA